MKALSLTQPWASALMLGVKCIETRSWATPYRGVLAIHAARRFPRWARDFAAAEVAAGHLSSLFPLGVILGVVRVVDVVRTETIRATLSAQERTYGDYADGRYAWCFTDVQP